MSYASEILADGPALHWRLGESAGTNANDETANNRDGTYVGTPTLGAAGALSGGGDSDTAVTFSGSGQWITSTYAITTGASYTFEAWAKRTDSVNEHTLWATDGAGAPMIARLDAGTDTLEFHSQAGSSVSWASCGIGTGAWRHVAIAFDNTANTAAFYLNGGLVSSKALAADFQATPGNFLMGAWSDSHWSPWYGGLDEIAVYPYILPAARIMTHCELGIATYAAQSPNSPATLGTVVRAGTLT